MKHLTFLFILLAFWLNAQTANYEADARTYSSNNHSVYYDIGIDTLTGSNDTLLITFDRTFPAFYGATYTGVLAASSTSTTAKVEILGRNKSSETWVIIDDLALSSESVTLSLTADVNYLNIALRVVSTTGNVHLNSSFLLKKKSSSAAAMLLHFVERGDTLLMLSHYIERGDTSAMLSHFIERADTSLMLVSYINRGDTLGMLTPYINRSDTISMLSPYIERGDTATMLTSLLDRGNNLSDVQSATTARNNILPSKTGNTLKVLRVNAGETDYELATVSGGVTDHGALTGLGDDDHTQYPLLLGRSGGQSLSGGTGTTDDLTLKTTTGVGASGADMHFLVGNNGATEAMTILNSGYVGIGKNAPIYPLHLKGALLMESSSDATHSIYQSASPNGSTQTIYIVQQASTASANMDLIVRYIPQGTSGRTAYQVWAGSDILNDGYLEFSHLGTEVQFKSNKTGSGTTAPINFLIGSTSTMYINTSSNIGIGTTSVGAKLHIQSTAEQLRSGYNASNYFSATTGSTGTTTLDAVGTAARFKFSDVINIPTRTPSSASDTGTTGDIAWDADYIYICTGTNTWKRTAISTW